MSLRRLIETVLEQEEATLTGRVASEFYEYYDIEGRYCWACDVDIGQPVAYTDKSGREQTSTVLRNVPIAFNNREIFYAQMGWPVTLRKTGDRYVIVGLAKSIKLTTDVVYVRFRGGLEIVRRGRFGFYYRRLSLGELGTVEPFGTLPLGVMGIYNAADDSLVRVRL